MNLLTIENPDAKWDQFVSGYPHLIFHTSIWGSVLKNGFNTKLLYYILEDKGEWLLGIPGMLSGRFLKLWYSLVPYGGFIGEREFTSEFVELIIKDIRKYKIDRLQIVDPEISRSDEISGFVAEESYWHILDLENKSEEDIWTGYKSKLRNTIREAIKAKLSVERIRDIQEVEIFYNLYLASMQRNRGMVRYPLQLFRRIFALITQGKGEIFFAKHNGMAIAGIVIIYSDEMAHYFHAGSLSNYLYLRPNNLLLHFAIQEAMRKDKKQFDFLGSAKDLTGLIQFKEKWGTQRTILYASHRDVSKIKPFLYKLFVPFWKFYKAGG